MDDDVARYASEHWVMGRILNLADAGSDTISSTVGKPSMSDTERSELNGTVRRLEGHMMIELDERFAGAWVARPRATGRARHAEMEKRRKSRVARRQHYRLAYLTWIYENYDGSMLTADDFLTSDAQWFGEPVTEADLQDAGQWLKDNGYIDGPGAWQRSDPLRVKLTSLGSRAIEHELPLGAPDTSPTTTHNYSIGTINGSASIAQGSTNVTQHIGGDWRELAHAMAVAIEALRESLPPEIRRDFEGHAATLRAEAAQKNGDDGKTRTVLTKIAESAASGGAGAAVGALATFAAAAMGLPIG